MLNNKNIYIHNYYYTYIMSHTPVIIYGLDDLILYNIIYNNNKL